MIDMAAVSKKKRSAKKKHESWSPEVRYENEYTSKKWSAAEEQQASDIGVDKFTYMLFLHDDTRINPKIAKIHPDQKIEPIMRKTFNKMYKPYKNSHTEALNKGKILEQRIPLEAYQKEAIIIACTLSLCEHTINTICNRHYNSIKLHAIMGACFSISSKMISAHNLNVGNKFLSVISSNFPRGYAPVKVMEAMESHIFKSTDYKGCDVATIDKFYNARFKELTRVKSQRSPKSSTKQSSRLKTRRNKSKAPHSGSAANP